jgi:hypothetical protein
MRYRNKLSFGGLQMKMGGKRIMVPTWQSSDNDGVPGADKAFFTEIITDTGYFGAMDLRRVGQEASSNNRGFGRANAYMETHHADVRVEVIFRSKNISGCPMVCVTPEAWEYGYAAFPEVWFDPVNGVGFWAIWAIAIPSARETIHTWGAFQILAPDIPRKITMEVIGRRIRCFDQNGVFTMESVIPKQLEGSTKHGVTHDVPMYLKPTGYSCLSATVGTANYVIEGADGINGTLPVKTVNNDPTTIPFYYEAVNETITIGGFEKGTAIYDPETNTIVVLSVISSSSSNQKVAWGTTSKRVIRAYATLDELTTGAKGGWAENPAWLDGLVEGAYEPSWTYTPITHFSDELPGVLGPERIRNINFETLTDWVLGAMWTHSIVDDPETATRPAVKVSAPDSATPFASGYITQTLTEPLVPGVCYRLTYNLQQSDLFAFINGGNLGGATVSAEIFDGIYTTGWIATHGQMSAKTVEFVATGPHTTIRFKADAQLISPGLYRLDRKITYVSLKEFTPA